jgi:hypothetical protein
MIPINTALVVTDPESTHRVAMFLASSAYTAAQDGAAGGQITDAIRANCGRLPDIRCNAPDETPVWYASLYW